MAESANETILNEALKQQIRIERLNTNQRRLIRRRLLELVALIEDLTRLARNDPTNVSSQRAQRIRLESLLQEIEVLVDEAFNGENGIHAMLRETLGEITRAELSSHIDIINDSIGARLLVSSITANRLGQLLDDLVFPSPSDTGNPNIFRGEARAWIDNIQFSFNRRLRSAWLGSLTDGPDLNSLLRGLRGDRPGRIGARSVAQVTENQAQAFYRTWQSSVNNEARIEIYKNNSDFIRSIRDVATFDDRTVQISIARHGNRYRLPGLEPMTRLDGGRSHAYLSGMPYHVGERNFYTPELRRISEIEKADRDYIRARVGRLNENQRAALDGKIPANTTFEGFLRRQDAGTQSDILGSTTYRLWRNGDLKLRDLIESSTGRPLSVAELESRYGSDVAENLR